MLLINTSAVFAMNVATIAPNMGVTTIECGNDDKRMCYRELHPNGKPSKEVPGGAKSVTTTKLELLDGLELNIGELPRITGFFYTDSTTNEFDFSTDEFDFSKNCNGIGMINVPSLYDPSIGIDIPIFFTNAIETGAIVINNFQEWYTTFMFINNSSNYVNGKALVYPNPTSSNTFIKLNDKYFSNITIQSAEYQLFSPNMSLIATINSIENITVIPYDYLTSNGVYTVICHITYLDTNNQIVNDTFTLTFIVSI